MTEVNTITLDAMNIGAFFGPIASPYSYKPELRRVLNGLYQAACQSDNRAFVLDGSTVVAAQTSRDSAISYMSEDRVLVLVDIPTPTSAQLAQAAQQWQFFPYRKCFIALKDGEEMQVILKPTAHYAGKLAREGWTVRELHR